MSTTPCGNGLLKVEHQEARGVNQTEIYIYNLHFYWHSLIIIFLRESNERRCILLAVFVLPHNSLQYPQLLNFFLLHDL